MADDYKVLGQLAPGAATLSTLYTVPASTQVIGSTLIACNRSATPTEIRVAVRPAGGVISDEMYIVYDMTIGANETLSFTIGMTLDTTDVVSVYATLATVSFNLFGVERT